MKNFLIVLSVCFSISIGILSCGNETGNPIQDLDQATTPEFVGTWLGVFPKIDTFLVDDVFIVADIKPDSSFKLTARYATSRDTVVSDTGNWTHRNDTLFLNGTKCEVLDMTTHIMRTLDSCSVVPIKIAISNDTMTIPLSGLTPIASSLGIKTDNLIVSILLSQGKIPFVKQK